MTPQHHLPADIERTSLSIITAELAELGLTPPPETAAVVKRVIHTTADFDYARNLRFTPGAVAAAAGRAENTDGKGYCRLQENIRTRGKNGLQVIGCML